MKKQPGAGKSFIRLLSLILASMMLLNAAACAQTTEGEADTSASAPEVQSDSLAEETTDLYPDDMPDTLDFNEAQIRFISATEQKSIALLDTDDTSDLVNEAVWKRNLAIEERLNVKLELVGTTGYDQFNTTVNNSVTANSDDYDVLCGHTRFNINLASMGILKNLGNIEYLDFEKPYWSKLYIDNITFKDIKFWATGDLALSFISFIYAMFVNSSMWTDYFSDVNIYNIVQDGKWTLDLLDEYSSVAYNDLNGNTKEDDGDSYGVVMQKGHVLNGMFFASGISYTTFDDAGMPSVTLDNERTYDIFDRLHALFYDTGYGRMLENAAFDTTATDMFAGGRLLFLPQTFGFTENEKVRAMEDDFYIIPLPKFDEAQPQYRVNQYDGVPLYGIPVTASPEKLDAIGASLEAMCALSSTMVVPVYYDIALKNKYSRDQETAAMLDLIHDCVTVDFSFAWGDSVGNIYNIFYDNIQNTSIAATIPKYTRVWAKGIDKLTTSLESNMDN